MKRLLILLIIVLAGAVPVQAQRGTGGMRGLTDISLSGGVAVPLGDFSDVANTGFHIGADLAHYASPRFAIGGEFAYDGFAASDLLQEAWVILTGDPGADISWSTIQATGYFKLLLTDQRTSPYIKAGAGIYSLRLTGSAYGLSETESESDLGIHGGMGVQFRGRGSTGGFVEAAYHNILTEGSSTKYIGFRGGITFVTGR